MKHLLPIYVEEIIILCYGDFGFTKNVFGLNNFLVSFSESDFTLFICTVTCIIVDIFQSRLTIVLFI